MTKLSFSISTKPIPKSTIQPKPSSKSHNLGSEKQYITEFDPSKTLASSNRTIIIPPKENEWPPRNLPSLQSDTESLPFEAEDDADDMAIDYGLNLREQSKRSSEDILLEKLRYDLHRLPEDRGLEEFKDVPIEGFGAALLAGYGWSEGRGIGKNAKEDVKVAEYDNYKRCQGRQGLGFVATSHDQN